MKMTRSDRDFYRNSLRKRCSEIGIDIPKNATIKQCCDALDAYYKKAVIVYFDDKACLRQTDESTDEYVVEFTISGNHTVRAVSEEAAREWVECRLDSCYDTSGHGDIEITEWELGDSYKSEDE